MAVKKLFILTIVFLLLLATSIFSEPKCPKPIMPDPKDVYWHKIKPSPYTRVIKSKKYGDFNFTKEAEESLEEYKNLCKKMGEYSIEIPAVGLVNKKNEIIKLLSPPAENILPLVIDIEEIYNYNKENTFLLNELNKVIENPEQRDDVILKIVANAIYHPLGRFYLEKENGREVIIASVFNQKVILPVNCVNIPLDFPLRKNWYIVTTPNTCYWTDYFMNYIEMQCKNMDLKAKIPIHLHPWSEMRWLLGTPEEYWIKELQVYLLPSGRDLEFFISRYKDSNIYIILGKDPYSDDLNWAIYDDIDLITKEMYSLESAKGDSSRIRIILEGVKKTRGGMQMYYAEKKKGLIVDKEIDDLLLLNKRQIAILSEIEEYEKQYSWRLFNSSFLVPLLNEKLAKIGCKIVPNKNEPLGYNPDKKEFYFTEGKTARMDLFLFILFKMCCLDTDDLTIGLKKEAYTIEFLKEICNQLDYLCIKYYHLEGLAEHMRYLANDMHLSVWNKEKAVLIAKEQTNNGRYYLDRYNLGYYLDTKPNDLKPIIEVICTDKVERIEIEDIIKELSKRHSIKNIEEFLMEFEERLMVAILECIWSLKAADFSADFS